MLEIEETFISIFHMMSYQFSRIRVSSLKEQKSIFVLVFANTKEYGHMFRFFVHDVSEST